MILTSSPILLHPQRTRNFNEIAKDLGGFVNL